MLLIIIVCLAVGFVFGYALAYTRMERYAEEVRARTRQSIGFTPGEMEALYGANHDRGRSGSPPAGPVSDRQPACLGCGAPSNDLCICDRICEAAAP